MGDSDVEAGIHQALADLLGDHDRAMATARASERYGQITLPFANIVRQQIDQQAGNARHELDGLRKRSDIPDYARVPAGEVFKAGDIVWIGEETDIEHQVAVGRKAISKTEAGDVEHDARLLAPAA